VIAGAAPGYGPMISPLRPVTRSAILEISLGSEGEQRSQPCVIHGVQTFLPILEANAGGGHIVNTASMAGLVAPPRLGAYSVTKYGVVALTEVLAAELAAQGSKVSASVLCPGTVRTNIGTSSRNRPPYFAHQGLRDVDIEEEDNPVHRWIDPEDAGAVAVRAIKRGTLYAITHPDWLDMVEKRHSVIANAFREAAAEAATDT